MKVQFHGARFNGAFHISLKKGTEVINLEMAKEEVATLIERLLACNLPGKKVLGTYELVRGSVRYYQETPELVGIQLESDTTMVLFSASIKAFSLFGKSLNEAGDMIAKYLKYQMPPERFH